jgi:hypothetical protein
MARKIVYCPYCTAVNGAVKKAGALKIIHDKFRAKKTAEEMHRWKASFQNAVATQKELGVHLSKAVHEDLNPLKVLDLFRRISDEVCASPLMTKKQRLTYINRIANCLAYNQNGDARRNSFGSISLFPRYASGHLWRRMALPTKMILLSNLPK